MSAGASYPVPAPQAAAHAAPSWRMWARGSALACALAAFACTLAALLPAPAMAAGSLSAALAGGVPFPQRTIVLTAPSGSRINPSRLTVTEDGRPVRGLSVTSLRQASLGELGLVLVIDTDPSMGGPPLEHALAAARALAAQRAGGEQLGVIFGNTVTLPLTSNAAAIDRALAQTPRIVRRTDLLSSMQIAVRELVAAHITDAAVIFVSDDVDRDPRYTPASVAAYAAAAHVRIFTVGVRDPAFARRNPQDLPPSAMRQLAQGAGGFYSAAAPAGLTRIITALESQLRGQYVLHYRSSRPLGSGRIVVRLQVRGIPGSASLTYSAPPARRQVVGASQHHHSTPFWRSSLALVLACLAAAILVGIAALALVRPLLAARSLSARVRSFLPAPPPGEGERGGTPTAGGALERPAEALARASWWPGFVERVELARMGRSPAELVYLTGLASLVIAALLIVAAGSVPLGILGLIAPPLALHALIGQRVRRQQARFNEELPAHLEEIAGAVRTGTSLLGALTVATADAGEPIRSEFERALADERLGRPLHEALRPIAARMRSDAMEQLAVIVSLQRRTGSSVAEVLDQIASSARDRDELRRELRALTAQGRLARWILTAIPPLLLVGFALINPRYERPLFHTTGGLVALVVAGLMVVAGSLVMKRIVEVKA